MEVTIFMSIYKLPLLAHNLSIILMVFVLKFKV